MKPRKGMVNHRSWRGWPGSTSAKLLLSNRLSPMQEERCLTRGRELGAIWPAFACLVPVDFLVWLREHPDGLRLRPASVPQDSITPVVPDIAEPVCRVL